MKDLDLTKLEFLLTINDNIIVQRFFNVRNYNQHAHNSNEFYNYICYLKEALEMKMKLSTAGYLSDYADEIMRNPSVLTTSNTDGPEYYNIYIKSGDRVLCHRQFDAKLYPPKVRYTVDIKRYVKNILGELSDILSDKDLTYDYLGYSTKVNIYQTN
jgi:hypothetical protein